MPITKSAKKALRQNISRRERNTAQKANIKALSKKITKLAAAKKTDEIKKTLVLATKAIDKATKTGILHKNTAARRKSLIARIANGGLK